MRLFAHSDGRDFDLDIRRSGDRLLVRGAGGERRVAIENSASPIGSAWVDDRRIDFGWRLHEEAYFLLLKGVEYRISVGDLRTELLEKAVRDVPVAPGTAEARAPIPGLITKILLKPGDEVRKGQPVLCLDAMKLENEIVAPRDGRIRTIEVETGRPVEKGQVLFRIGPP